MTDIDYSLDTFLRENNIDMEKFVKLGKQQAIMRELLFLDREKTIDKCIMLVEHGLRPYISTGLSKELTKTLEQYKQRVCNLDIEKDFTPSTPTDNDTDTTNILG